MKHFIKSKKQVLFFIIAGGLSAVVEIGSFKIFSVIIPKISPMELDFLGIHYPFSNICSTCCGILFNYILSINFVFERGKHSKKREFTYFMGTSFAATFLSLLLFQLFYLYIFTHNVNLELFTLSNAVISKISAIAIVSFINYFVKKKLIFNG